VQAAQLASVRQSLYTDPAAGGVPGELIETAYEPNAGQILLPTPPVTGVVTDYVGVGAPDLWQQGYFTPTNIFYTAGPQDFAAGHSYSVEWGHGPAAPVDGIYGAALSAPLNICLTCASGGNLTVGFYEVGDSEPGHVGMVAFGGSTHYTLYQNGAPIYDAVNTLGANLSGVPNAPTTYREVLDTDLSNVPGLTESTSTHTDVTFRYVPGADPGDTLPVADLCDRGGAIAAPCQILPVLNLDYHLATDLTGTSHSRVQVMRLDVRPPRAPRHRHCQGCRRARSEKTGHAAAFEDGSRHRLRVGPSCSNHRT
jgi:hypothetical protein